MARNAVQFQKGLSEPEFERLYGTEEQCRAVVVASRWPDGFTCPICAGREHSQVKSRGLFQCTACRRQTSPIAGTIFASTKLPLRTWFRAMYHVPQTKQGISSIELGRRLGVTQTTAWKVKHKLKQVMLERDASKQLTGRVEIDDAYLGGERSGGKRGRGAAGKTPFVAAVETTPGRQAGPHQAGTSQRFFQPGTVGVRQALPRSKLFGRQRRASVFRQCHRCRMHPPGHQDGKRDRGSTQAGVQVGQHRSRQHQGGDCRHLPIHQQQACPALPRRVRVSLQPAIRSHRYVAAPLLGQCADHAHALSAPQIG